MQIKNKPRVWCKARWMALTGAGHRGKKWSDVGLLMSEADIVGIPKGMLFRPPFSCYGSYLTRKLH